MKIIVYIRNRKIRKNQELYRSAFLREMRRTHRYFDRIAEYRETVPKLMPAQNVIIKGIFAEGELK